MTKYEEFTGLLTSANLIVSGETITVQTPNPFFKEIDEIEELAKNPQPLGDGLAGRILAITGRITGGPRASKPGVTVGGGRLGSSLNKRNKRNKRNKHNKRLNKKNAAMNDAAGIAATLGFDWPEIDVPWMELGILHKLRDEYKWDRLPTFKAPPALDVRMAEVRYLHQMQDDLKKPENAWRRARIEIEADNDLTAYMLPLGANVTAPSSETAVMFQTLLWLGGLIGQHYKARFDAPRPSELDPTLEPYLPVPAHSSYPSNHTFQSFLIAETFARAVPEHPGLPALYHAAWEVGVNREWAGLHLRSDTIAGRNLARLCMPVIERVMAEQMALVRDEWY